MDSFVVDVRISRHHIYNGAGHLKPDGGGGKRVGKPVKIIVLSGKGGVGKSTVAAALAVALSKRGHKVLMFDTDIDGPNCRRILGVSDKTMHVDSFMHPIDVNENLKLFSVDGHPFIAKEGYGLVWLGEQT